MYDIWNVIVENGRPVSAVRLPGPAAIPHGARRVWTLTEFCRRSGKSRRQIYRDIQDGKIRPLGKFLDDWLVEPSELANLLPPPPTLASLLPEYDIASLDLDRERELVLSRVMRFGGRDRLRWAFSFYGADSLKRFVLERGAKLLDERSLRFWSLYFRVPAAPVPAVRRKGRRWGGAL